ncbi:MAG TPA: hypothetical protein VK391_00855 [Allosphingosinicella sp.]|nr:hypothetical protein [Allosphingosinicella sp.]
MRRSVPLIALLLATACGQGSQQETKTSSQDLRTFDIAEEAPPPDAPPPPPPPPPMVSTEMSRTVSPPQIGPTAAPGVAFNYRYAFRLPGERIAAVQEQHAAACEKLGLDRCRITGMRYRLMGDDDVQAMLAFKLDPAIARQFGKSGIETVAQSEGMLVDSEISGEDAGADIERATRNVTELEEDLNRVEAQLARAGLRSSERAELQMQAERIRESIRATRANREDRRESLAKTPMVFNYGSGDLAPGFDTRAPLKAALERAADNFVQGFGMLLVLFVTALPWAIVLFFLVWLFRRFGGPLRRFLNPTLREDAPPSERSGG